MLLTRSAKAPIAVAAVVVAAVALLTLAGQRPAAAAEAALDHRIITVQLRHDLLGLKTDTGLTIDDVSTARRASVTGKMISLNDEFIIVEIRQREEVWVPRGNVLLIHFTR